KISVDSVFNIQSGTFLFEGSVHDRKNFPLKEYWEGIIRTLTYFITNWINLVGIFIAAYFFGIIEVIADPSYTAADVIMVGILGGLFGLLFYGFIFWLGFILAMLILDFLLMGTDKRLLYPVLIFEWLVVSAPFFYWLFKYAQWSFLVAICAFF